MKKQCGNVQPEIINVGTVEERYLLVHHIGGSYLSTILILFGVVSVNYLIQTKSFERKL